ncbi:MAG: CAP domain-containing protein [Nocardioides sp.]|nr:CAP domain-containing protein [Nocardioides sp.]
MTRTATLLVSLITGMLVVTLAPSSASAATWAVPTTRTEQTATNLDEYENQLMVEINRARQVRGIRRIARFDQCVDRLSERWGRRIARTGIFAHRDQQQVISECRVSWAGENLVRGSMLAPEDMVQAWLNSPGHRKILLSRRARRAGVAVKRDAQGRYIGVLNVVRPR